MNKMIITNSAAETEKLAVDLASTLRGGETFALNGDLGAGKTTFVQALARALGVRERVTSPTFVLMHVHDLKKSAVSSQRSAVRFLVHADAYRGDAEVLKQIGLEEYLGDPTTVTLIEWADRTESILPVGTIKINFKHLGGDRRVIRISRP